jgi:CheY-like chemotaxis protein
LRQVLVNIVGNAIKFTTMGEVVISLELDGADPEHPRQLFRIRDTGIGMTRAQVAQLYQPFAQANSSTARSFGGTGLGLAISKRLIEMMKGEITVVSEPGRGTTFTVALPTRPLADLTLFNPHLPERAEISTPPVPTGDAASYSERFLGGIRVLLAEDGPDNQRLIARILTRAGAEVVVVESGELAVEAALAAVEQDDPFGTILMDIQMPSMDGYMATALLRERGYTGAIVALTAHAMASDRAKCLAAGCDAYLGKPIDRDTLLATVARYSRRPVPPENSIRACGERN